jgi:hypothetical protein
MTNTITTSAPGWSAALTPQTTDDAWKIATALAKSPLIPKAFQGAPGDVIIAANMGARLGLDIFSAMQSIAVVNGRPTLWGDAMLAVCQARTDWRGQTVAWSGEAATPCCTVTIRRQVGQAVDEYAGQFSAEDAKKAGLWTKQGPWSQYPRRMLELRARAFALRGAFADALLGFHAREEVEDYVDVTASAQVREEPRGRKVRQVAPAIDSTAAPAADDTSGVAQPTTEQPVTGRDGASEGPVAADPAAGEAERQPTEDDVRIAMNRASGAQPGGIKSAVAAVSTGLGYPVGKAADIKPEDRAKAIRIADDLAGIGG